MYTQKTEYCSLKAHVYKCSHVHTLEPVNYVNPYTYKQLANSVTLSTTHVDVFMSLNALLQDKSKLKVK